MQRNRWAWRGASGVLGVVCLALVALNFLPPPEDQPPAPSRTNLAEPVTAAEPHASGLAAGAANVATRHDALNGAVRLERGAGAIRARSKVGADPSAKESPGQASGVVIAPGERLKVVAETGGESKKIVPKSPTAPDGQNVAKPLGYVETADGQKKAIIGEGEWIQLVAEGQTLADNSRVVKVTPTSVEIVPGNEANVASKAREPRPPVAAPIQAASAEPEPPGIEPVVEDLPEVADAETVDPPGPPTPVQTRSAPAQTRLPHEVEPEASLASSWRGPLSRPEPRLTEPEKPAAARLPVEAALPPSASQPAAGSSQPLGFVQKADGTTLTVMADGDSVRFEEQPQIASVTPPSLPADLPGGMGWLIPNVGFGAASPLGSRTGPGNGISPAATLKALGYVRQADGRLQAILDVGDSVQLVEEGQVLADGSRVVGITATSVEVTFEPNDNPTGLPAREQHLLAAATAGSGILRLRAPSTEARLAPPQPVPRARGMPSIGIRAASTRPPPNRAARDWIGGRSRAQPPEEARQAAPTGRSLPIATTREALLATDGRGEGEVCLEGGRGADADGLCARPERYSIRSLGFVEWSGGRLQAIVSQGDGVELLEEGQTLTDGSRVVAVSRHAVELSRGMPASSRSHEMGPKWLGGTAEFLAGANGAGDNEPSAGQEFSSSDPLGSGVPSASGLPADRDTLTSTQRVGGTELQLNRPMRDNGQEPRK